MTDNQMKILEERGMLTKENKYLYKLENYIDDYLNLIDLIAEIKVLIKQHLDRYEKEIDSISYIFLKQLIEKLR